MLADAESFLYQYVDDMTQLMLYIHPSFANINIKYLQVPYQTRPRTRHDNDITSKSKAKTFIVDKTASTKAGRSAVLEVMTMVKSST